MKRTCILLARAALSIAIVAFLALSPRWLLQHNEVDHYRSFYEKPTPDWYGAIELWHIVGFRTYQGSVTNFLQARANEFCDTRPGVHINVTGMSIDRYQERIARGDLPDGYCFPVGLLYREQLQQIVLDTPAYAANIKDAVADGGIYAVPYFLSAYVYMENTLLAAERAPGSAKQPDPALLDEALGEAEESQLYIPAVLAAEAGMQGESAPYERFSSGKAAYAIADLRALGDIERRTKEPMQVNAAPYPGFCDLVQYLGAARDTDARRAAELAAFYAFLLTQEEQTLLPSLGALPVLKDVPDAVFASQTASECYLLRAECRYPDAFLYQQQKDALLQDALGALGGEGDKADSFWQRMSVVMGG